jgi:predicted HTH transcriptional regulator
MMISDRHQKILEALKNDPDVTVRELAKMLHMTNGSVASAVSREVSGFHKVIIPECWPNDDGGLWYYDEHGKAVTLEA